MHLMLASNRVECCPERFQMQAATAMVSATLGKAKVLGLVVDKQELKSQVLNHNINVTFEE